jgi:hypothetical protein
VYRNHLRQSTTPRGEIDREEYLRRRKDIVG